MKATILEIFQSVQVKPTLNQLVTQWEAGNLTATPLRQTDENLQITAPKPNL